MRCGDDRELLSPIFNRGGSRKSESSRNAGLATGVRRAVFSLNLLVGDPGQAGPNSPWMSSFRERQRTLARSLDQGVGQGLLARLSPSDGGLDCIFGDQAMEAPTRRLQIGNGLHSQRERSQVQRCRLAGKRAPVRHLIRAGPQLPPDPHSAARIRNSLHPQIQCSAPWGNDAQHTPVVTARAVQASVNTRIVVHPPDLSGDAIRIAGAPPDAANLLSLARAA